MPRHEAGAVSRSGRKSIQTGVTGNTHEHEALAGLAPARAMIPCAWVASPGARPTGLSDKHTRYHRSSERSLVSAPFKRRDRGQSSLDLQDRRRRLRDSSLEPTKGGVVYADHSRPRPTRAGKRLHLYSQVFVAILHVGRMHRHAQMSIQK